MCCARFSGVSETEGHGIDVCQSREVMWKDLAINFEEECVRMAKQADGLRERGHTEGQILTVVSIQSPCR